MARLIRSEAQGPAPVHKAEMEKDTVWICMCGLSKNKPYCDGSHKATRDEEEGKLYRYADDGSRNEASE